MHEAMATERQTSNWRDGLNRTAVAGLSRISPPPLKRQRSSLLPDEAEPPALPSHLELKYSENPHRQSSALPANKPYLDTLSGFRSGSEPHRRSHSTSRNSMFGSHGLSAQTSKSRKSMTDSNALSMSASTSKPKCQVCMKSSNVKYDPLVSCPGCRRHYHDSCRKPSLAEGVDATGSASSVLVTGQERSRGRQTFLARVHLLHLLRMVLTGSPTLLTCIPSLKTLYKLVHG
ncbi:hypothetical protein IQ06DRAFT_150208 [Phaeosphaeriaceae sp. SRC1lsM3a]|nr:hypothetical protein IQ06DRAFT_150208 [Stagonospora sp. SRC1lsM3a]